MTQPYNPVFGYPNTGFGTAGERTRLPPVSETRALPEDEVEEVDALPVVGADMAPAAPAGSARGLVTRTPAQVAAQVAAVAVTGFAAGAVVTAVARHAKAGRARTRPRRELRGAEIVATRTFLVDVHLLGGRE